MATATATKPVKPAPLAPEAADALIAAIRDKWDTADRNETKALALFDAAKLAWENARVIKVRVAYAAAMISPVKGEANLLNATRILKTDPNDSAAARTKAAKSLKNSIRNYVDAGTALNEAGLANRTGEPDENERKIVADVFRAGNKRDKDADKTPKEPAAGGENEPDVDGGEPDGLTFADLMGVASKLNNWLDMMIAGDVVVSEREASAMADVLTDFQAKLSGYAEGK